MEKSGKHEGLYAGLPPSEPDCSRLVTPARRLTLGRLYAAYAGQYSQISNAVQTMLLLEDRIATLNYRWAADFEDRTPAILERHKKDIESLTELYIVAGLAPGRHQAEEMIRDIAAQGRSQAPDTLPH